MVVDEIEDLHVGAVGQAQWVNLLPALVGNSASNRMKELLAASSAQGR